MLNDRRRDIHVLVIGVTADDIHRRIGLEPEFRAEARTDRPIIVEGFVLVPY
ncbi:hypothetical protein D3C80_2150590 [compost metagenome]